jgi:hypothetical protein
MVSLEAPGVAASEKEGRYVEFTPRQRLMRAGKLMLIALGLAVAFLPIPIIHLLAIPMLLIGGIALSLRQLSMAGMLRPLRIPCPKCGAGNRVGRMLGVRSIEPLTVECDSCRRELTRRITVID